MDRMLCTPNRPELAERLSARQLLTANRPARHRLHAFMDRHGWRGPSERGRTVRVGESCWRAPALPPDGNTHHVQLTVNVVGGDSWWAAEVRGGRLPYGAALPCV